MDRVSLIIACAGKGVRAGFNKNKLLVNVGDKPVIATTYDVCKNSGLFSQIILSVSPTDYEFVKGVVDSDAILVVGGNTRTQSVKNALEKVTGDIVLIHDGARPFVTEKVLQDCIDTVRKHGGAIPVVPSRDTILKSDGATVTEYLGKSELYSVQTPQGFKTELIKRAYAHAGEKTFNDDGEVFKEYIYHHAHL